MSAHNTTLHQLADTSEHPQIVLHDEHEAQKGQIAVRATEQHEL